MRVDGNMGGTASYEPNSHGVWQEQPEFKAPPLELDGAADHWNHRSDDDHFAQPGALFRLMTPTQQQALFDNTARALRGVSVTVCARHVHHCTLADPAYGAGVAVALATLTA
jgi:catalase